MRLIIGLEPVCILYNSAVKVIDRSILPRKCYTNRSISLLKRVAMTFT